MKPWLWLPPKLAHDLSPLALELVSQFYDERTPAWGSFIWNEIVFKNRLGLAGGVDKNGDHLLAWQKLGCGFIEVGTVTPEPQSPNPGQILDRSVKDLALWNKMGFPSAGAEDVFFNVRSFKQHSNIPVFVNIGKNRTTPNEMAASDYVKLIHRFQNIAEAFVVNISSPNTKGLRDLAQPEVLSQFLKPIAEAQNEFRTTKPLLIKLSPDLQIDDLKRAIDTCHQFDIDGYVLTNTTLERKTQKQFSTEGGVSGKPVAERSKTVLRAVIEHLGSEKSKKLVISVGGVMTARDVFERIDMGADLVEVYTTLIFSGLHFFRKVAGEAHASKQGTEKA
jgi:dihydroorotate dehydrogenase